MPDLSIYDVKFSKDGLHGAIFVDEGGTRGYVACDSQVSVTEGSPGFLDRLEGNNCKMIQCFAVENDEGIPLEGAYECERKVGEILKLELVGSDVDFDKDDFDKEHMGEL